MKKPPLQKDDGFPLDALKAQRRKLCERAVEKDYALANDDLKKIARVQLAIMAMEAVVEENARSPDLKRELLSPSERESKAKAERASAPNGWRSPTEDGERDRSELAVRELSAPLRPPAWRPFLPDEFASGDDNDQDRRGEAEDC